MKTVRYGQKKRKRNKTNEGESMRMKIRQMALAVSARDCQCHLSDFHSHTLSFVCFIAFSFFLSVPDGFHVARRIQRNKKMAQFYSILTPGKLSTSGRDRKPSCSSRSHRFFLPNPF